MVYYSDNLSHDIDSFLRAEDKRLQHLPVCNICGEHIQQETAVKIGDFWYCDECLFDSRCSIDIF